MNLQVEKEVEHDTRIRRSYKNIRGQHNVPCWQWLGPSTATFDSIGVSGHIVVPQFHPHSDISTTPQHDTYGVWVTSLVMSGHDASVFVACVVAII